MEERLRTDSSIEITAIPIVEQRVPSNSCVLTTCITEGQGTVSHTGVSAASRIGSECAKPDPHVVGADGIGKKRLRTDSRALTAVNVVEQSLAADCSVLVPIGIVSECLETNTRVPDASGETCEHTISHRRVLISAASWRVGANLPLCQRKRKTEDCDWQNKKAAARMRAADGSYYVFHFLIHFSLMLPC
jgi:hypothetical protein